MVDDATRARMEALEKRLSEKRRAPVPEARSGRGFSGAEIAYRMVIELVVALMMGCGIGYGLDVLFGTLPILLVIFTGFGFAAGVNVMLRTAKEISTGDPPANGASPQDEKD